MNEYPQESEKKSHYAWHASSPTLVIQSFAARVRVTCKAVNTVTSNKLFDYLVPL